MYLYKDKSHLSWRWGC